ncbi:protein of unknown function [Streptomyces murinus]
MSEAAVQGCGPGVRPGGAGGRGAGCRGCRAGARLAYLRCVMGPVPSGTSGGACSRRWARPCRPGPLVRSRGGARSSRGVSCLPAVPAALAAAAVRGADDEAQQPHDEHDHRDPPQCLQGEARAEEDQGQKKNKNQGNHRYRPPGHRMPLLHSYKHTKYELLLWSEGHVRAVCPGRFPRSPASRTAAAAVGGGPDPGSAAGRAAALRGAAPGVGEAAVAVGCGVSPRRRELPLETVRSDTVRF